MEHILNLETLIGVNNNLNGRIISLKVKRAIYKDKDGYYIYSTLDITIPQSNIEFLQGHKYTHENRYDCIPFHDLFKMFSRYDLEREYTIIEIDSDLDKDILDLKTFPIHLVDDDESKAYVDTVSISEKRKKEN